MKNMPTTVVLIFSVWWINNAWSNCIPGHSNIPLSDSMITKFCADYSKLTSKEQQDYKSTYNQYCKKPNKASVSAKKPVLTRASVKGDCLTSNSEILFKGRDFGERGSAYMSQSGRDQELKVRGWSDKRIRASIGRGVTPGKSYQLWLKTDGGKSSSKKLIACKEVEASSIVTQVSSVKKEPADLVITLDAPDEAIAGEAIPRLSLKAANIGQSTVSGYTIALVLSKDNQVVVKHLGSQTKADDKVLETTRVTSPLMSKKKKKYLSKGEIPTDTLAGDYYLCAQIDPSNQVKESKEDNNTNCKRIKVAAAKQDAPVVVKLDPQARNRIGQQGTIPVTPDKIKPIDTQLLSTYYGLRINRQLLARVREGQPAILQWNLSVPEGTGADSIFLFADSGAGFPSDFCVRAAEEHWRAEADVRGLGYGIPVSDRGYHAGLSGEIHLDTGPPLMVGIGAQYQYMACLWNSELNRPTGDTTNIAQLYLLEDASYQAEIDQLLHESQIPDLLVNSMILNRSGPLRGKILFTVTDRNDKRQDGTVDYAVYVDDVLVEESTVNFGRNPLGGWSGSAITEYALPIPDHYEGRDIAENWHIVTIRINQDRSYEEEYYANNSRTEAMTLGSSEALGPLDINKILHVWKEDEGDRWMKVGVRYMKSAHYAYSLAISDPARDFICKAGNENRSIFLEPGDTHGVKYFLCKLASHGPGARPDISTDEVQTSQTSIEIQYYGGITPPADTPREIQRIWSLPKIWMDRYTNDRVLLPLPQLEAIITYMRVADSYEGIDTGSCDLRAHPRSLGRNAEFAIIITNKGIGLAPASQGEWSISNHHFLHPGPCLGETQQQYRSSFSVPALEPRETYRNTFRIPENVILHTGGFGHRSALRVKTDHGDRIFEMSFSNFSIATLPDPGGSWTHPDYPSSP